MWYWLCEVDICKFIKHLCTWLYQEQMLMGDSHKLRRASTGVSLHEGASHIKTGTSACEFDLVWFPRRHCFSLVIHNLIWLYRWNSLGCDQRIPSRILSWACWSSTQAATLYASAKYCTGRGIKCGTAISKEMFIFSFYWIWKHWQYHNHVHHISCH